MVRGQWVNLARTPGLHLYSFSKDILGFFMKLKYNIHTMGFPAY